MSKTINVIRTGKKGALNSRYGIETKIDALNALNATNSKVTVEDVAAAIGCSENTVKYWQKQEKELRHSQRAFAVMRINKSRPLTRQSATI